MGTGTPARTLMRAAVKYNWQQITATNNYRSTVKGVFDPMRNIERMTDFPVVNLEWGAERREGDRIAGNDPLLDLYLTCTAHVFLRTDNLILAQDNILADSQELFGTNFYITGSDGKRTVFVCTYEGSDPWGLDEHSGRPNGGISIDFLVHYRIRLADATKMR